MQFTIPCEIYGRLARIADTSTWRFKPEPLPHLKCIHLEHKSGETVAVVSNRKIAAVQRIGKTDQPDGAISIIIDPSILAQCEIEARTDGELIIDVTNIPGFRYAQLRSSLGWAFSGNVGLFFDTPSGLHDDWQTWRRILPPAASKKSKGFMYLWCEALAQLAFAAPSGAIVFPECINTDEVIFVQDSIDTDWLGLFIGVGKDASERKFNAATMPKWLK